MPVQELSKVITKNIKDHDVTEYVIRDQIIFSPGKWKGHFYPPEIVKTMFEATNWDDPQINDLFLDHYDGTPDSLGSFIRGGMATWVGKIKNVRYSRDIVADLHVVDLNTANKLAYPDTKFGISAKLIAGIKEGTTDILTATYKNTSIVIEPAVKTAYIHNSEDADKAFSDFIRKIAKEVIMTMADKKTPAKTEEKIETEKPEQPTETKTELTSEQLIELENAAKLVLEFIKTHKLEHSEEPEDEEPPEDEKTEEEPEEKPEEETKEEPEKTEEPTGEKPEEEPKDKPTEELAKAIHQMSEQFAKINDNKPPETPKQNDVLTIECAGLVYSNPEDFEMVKFLENDLKKRRLQ